MAAEIEVVKSQLHRSEGTDKPCKTCKWQIGDPMYPGQGQCVVNRTESGSIWKRHVREPLNMTCTKHEEGAALTFRDLV